MTKHTATCTMTFGRPNPSTGCPRCAELAAGAAPRTWNLSRNAAADKAQLAAIRSHNCTTSHCGPVCTAFDW